MTILEAQVAVHLRPSSLNLPHINDGSAINDIRRRCGRLIDFALDHYLFTDARHGFHLPGLQNDIIAEKPDLTHDHELHLFLRPSVPVRGPLRLRSVRLHCTGCGVEARP